MGKFLEDLLLKGSPVGQKNTSVGELKTTRKVLKFFVFYPTIKCPIALFISGTTEVNQIWNFIKKIFNFSINLR
ncbi:MAG: hypothetical protein EBY07_12345 [Actinobacteria bacterium]|nr:hypothetical protein [Actinomycetota bacterium]